MPNDPILSCAIEGLHRTGSMVRYTNPALPHITGRGVVCLPAPDDVEDAEDADCLVPWIGLLEGRDAGQEALDSLAPGAGACAGFSYRMDAPHCLSLDLTDPTSRLHTAWWAVRQPRPNDELLLSITWWSSRVTLAHDLALKGLPMTNNQIAMLRDLCLRLAEEAT